MTQQNKLASSEIPEPLAVDQRQSALSDQEVLDLIQHIAGDDFCEDLDMRAGSITDPMLKTAHEKLSAIYRYSHAFVKANRCHGVHNDWREEARTAANHILDGTPSPEAQSEGRPEAKG